MPGATARRAKTAAKQEQETSSSRCRNSHEPVGVAARDGTLMALKHAAESQCMDKSCKRAKYVTHLQYVPIHVCSNTFLLVLPDHLPFAPSFHSVSVSSASPSHYIALSANILPNPLTPSCYLSQLPLILPFPPPSVPCPRCVSCVTMLRRTD